MKNPTFNDLMFSAERRAHKILDNPDCAKHVDALGKASRHAVHKLSDADVVRLLREVDKRVEKLDAVFLCKYTFKKRRKNMAAALRAMLEAVVIVELSKKRKIFQHVSQSGMKLVGGYTVFFSAA